MSYPSELEESVHRQLARGDLAAVGVANTRFVRALKASDTLEADLLVILLLHSCLWRVRRTLTRLYGDIAPLPAREDLARLLIEGTGLGVVDRYERAFAAMIGSVIDADGVTLSPARRARGFVDRNASRPISTVNVARAVACSETHLCALFREAYGTTVGRYIRRRRIDRAKALLAATRLPVKAVAYASGFTTYRTFLRNFRGVTGTSPLRYRRRAQRAAGAAADGNVADA